MGLVPTTEEKFKEAVDQARTLLNARTKVSHSRPYEHTTVVHAGGCILAKRVYRQNGTHLDTVSTEVDFESLEKLCNPEGDK